MPTGYTASVQDGKITEFPEFAMECARAFGACVELRDSPDATIPDEFAPSDYHAKQITAARERLAALVAMTDEDRASGRNASYAASVERRRSAIEKSATERARYEAMIVKVNDWTPPTADHKGMKVFMLEQLTSSLKFDCHSPEEVSRYYPLDTETPEEWHGREVAKAKADIEYHEGEHKKEVERAASRTAWIKALRESLAPAVATV